MFLIFVKSISEIFPKMELPISKELLFFNISKDINVDNADIGIVDTRSIGGGCINNAFKIETNRGIFFLKVNNFGLCL